MIEAGRGGAIVLTSSAFGLTTTFANWLAPHGIP